jgi:hypothetical protein
MPLTLKEIKKGHIKHNTALLEKYTKLYLQVLGYHTLIKDLIEIVRTTK